MSDSPHKAGSDGKNSGSLFQRFGARSLSARTTLLVTLVLLPLGVLSTVQAVSMMRDAERQLDDAFAARVAAAVQPQREVLLAAVGKARGFARTLSAIDLSEEECVQTARSFRENFQYEFVGFIDTDAQSSCNDRGVLFDLSDRPQSRELVEGGVATVLYRNAGAISGAPVLIVSEPVHDEGGQLLGFVSISVPTLAIDQTDDEGLSISTFNDFGQIMSGGLQEVGLTADDLVRSAEAGDWLLESVDTLDDGSRYAIAPLVPGSAYALGRQPVPVAASASLFAAPVVIWLITLGVALLSLRDQIYKPIENLKLRMEAFSDRRMPGKAPDEGRFAKEFDDISRVFQDMTVKIIHDEAELEHQYRERGQLLQEIHHRVKNNLQLISSIINMQMRSDEDIDTATALRLIQRRLQAVARFHENLYQNASLSSLRADEIVRKFIEESLPGIDLSNRVTTQPIYLSADQTSHLAMLVSEALLGALQKDSAAVERDFEFDLRTEGEEKIRAEVVLPKTAAPEPTDVSGRLINAFAQQLNAHLTTKEKGEYVRMFVVAEVATPEKSPIPVY